MYCVMNSVNSAVRAIWGVVETAVDETAHLAKSRADDFFDSMVDMRNKIFYSKQITQGPNQQYNGFVLVETDVILENENKEYSSVMDFLNSLMESLYLDGTFQFNAF